MRRSMCGMFAAGLIACGVTGVTNAGTAVAWAKTPSSVIVTLTDEGFRPAALHGKLDVPMHLHVTNRGQHIHQFSIPDFYIYSRVLQPGESSDITFAPYKVGRFQVMSDPAGDNTAEFHGQIVVE